MYPEQNLRFAGQYLDRETGLHYNTLRYFLPESGRFSQPDPIGLMGGLNPYAYVDGNPVSWIDSLGLKGGPDFEINPTGDRTPEPEYVYRVLRDNEIPEVEGLRAKNPNATYAPEGHVLHT